MLDAPPARSGAAIFIHCNAAPFPASKFLAVPFHDLGCFLASETPQDVTCWLMSASYDAADVAMQLSKAGFAGCLTIAAGGLPNPGMIKRELARAHQGFRLRMDASLPFSSEARHMIATLARHYPPEERLRPDLGLTA